MEQNQLENTDPVNNNSSDNAESTPNLETQEQINSANLSQRIEEKNQSSTDYSDANEITDKASQGEEDLSGFLERTLPGQDSADARGKEQPSTRNLLGDNPPGSEQAAFEAGTYGDASAEQFKYESENLVEGFRENLDKTEQQVNLDKKLKKDSEEGDQND
ncbi:MAG: hypothetical protein ACO1N7_10120 [Sphingobacteriaceae bacterium]